jgi:hypothetical protein
MSGGMARDPGFDDEDRLPWLESAEEEYREGPPIGRILLAILGILALIAIAVFGYRWLAGGERPGGTGDLIPAPQGDYKIKPDEPGGMKVDGEGDQVFATSAGKSAKGAINTDAVPEAPIAGKTVKPSPTPTDAGTAKVVTAIPPRGGMLKARQPDVALPKITIGGSSALVQLGSFPNESGANAAWAQLSKRFAYLASLGKSVEKAEVNGNTVYRLRVNAGGAGAARELCGRLKIAGEACFVPN